MNPGLIQAAMDLGLSTWVIISYISLVKTLILLVPIFSSESFCSFIKCMRRHFGESKDYTHVRDK